MFSTKAAAEKRAAELKCTGIHGSDSVWKLCKDKAAYDSAVKALKK